MHRCFGQLEKHALGGRCLGRTDQATDLHGVPAVCIFVALTDCQEGGVGVKYGRIGRVHAVTGSLCQDVFGERYQFPRIAGLCRR